MVRAASAGPNRRRYPVADTTSTVAPAGRPSSPSAIPRQSWRAYQPPVQSSTALTVVCGSAGVVLANGPVKLINRRP